MQFTRMATEWASLPAPTIQQPKDFAEKLEAARRAQGRGGFDAPSGPAFHPSASAFPAVRPWNDPQYQCSDPKQKPKKMMKKPPGVVMPPALKEPLTDFIPMNERPIAVQDYVWEYTAFQEAGTGQQEKEVLMDQSGSQATLSMVGSSGCSSRSGITQGAQVAAEMEALEAFPYESETPSEQADRQAMEAGYIGSPESLTGDDGKEEGEYTGEDRDDNEPEGEGATAQATKMTKSAKPGGGGPKEGA